MIRRLILAFLVGAGLCAPAAFGQAPDELVRRAQAIGGRIDAANREGIDALLQELGELSVAFVQAAETAGLAGGRDREVLRQAYAAIAQPMERLRKRNESIMESGERAIIEADGDLEEFYDSPAYQQAQYVAANVRYYLNWLQYYGAGLHEGETRRKLLREAREGFSAFTSGDAESELVVESILGRGLCALDLGELKAAVGDLATVSRSPRASAERRRKAKLSLLEAYVQSGNTAAALRESEEILSAGDTPEANWVRYMRLRALLDAVKRGGGDAAKHRVEVVGLMERLRRAGGAWEQRIAAVAQEAFADADAWKASAQTPFARWELAKLYVQKEDYESARPLLEGVLASDDAGVAKHKAQARYFLGLAQFRAGEFTAALEHLSGPPDGLDGPDVAERSYLVFKAHEALAVAAGPEADLDALTAAASEFLARAAKHPAAFEARFRLAEMAQRAGEFAEAIELYSAVTGDPLIELQAAFATAQCHFELVRSADPAERDARLAEAGAALDAFEARRVSSGVKSDDGALEAIGAKAAVMRAVQRKLLTPPDHEGIIAALVEFETKYPQQAELLPQVVRLRLEASRDSGGFALALDQAEKFAALLYADLDAVAVEELAGSFIRAGARRAGEGDRAASDTAQRVAAALFAPVVAAGEAGARTKLTLARLRENAGELDVAAALYREILDSSQTSTTAVRGLARIAEAQERHDEALQYWSKLGEVVNPGDLPWYESHYERARVLEQRGAAAAACELLGSLRAAMPGLQDAELREKLTGLYERSCR